MTLNQLIRRFDFVSDFSLALFVYKATILLREVEGLCQAAAANKSRRQVPKSKESFRCAG
jgi:hypothetical protein